MLAWSEGTDNGRQKTRNHGYDVIVEAETVTDYSGHPPANLSRYIQNSNQRARTLQLLSRWWDACRTDGGLKDFSRKVRTLRGIATD